MHAATQSQVLENSCRRSNGYAKLTYAKLHLAEGNIDAGRKALEEALEIWSDASDDYIFLIEAEALMSEI